MKHVVKISLMAIAIGYLANLGQNLISTSYLDDYLGDNLITILIALLAINSATTGIVLTKVREIIDAGANAETFLPVKDEMVKSVREQIVLVCLAIILLTVQSSGGLSEYPRLLELFDILIVGVFAYALHVLYDISIGVMVLFDFEG